MMVAGFEFTRMTSSPSSFSALPAGAPEWSNSAPCPMTMGPEPMRRMRWRSGRRGMEQIGDDGRAGAARRPPGIRAHFVVAAHEDGDVHGAAERVVAHERRVHACGRQHLARDLTDGDPLAAE